VGMAAELRDHRHEMTEQTRQDLLTILAGQSDEVAAIVEDLLVAARSDPTAISFETRPVDLWIEIDSVLAGRRAALDVEGVKPPLITGDSQRVRQVLRNLLLNAERYGGDQIRLVTGETDGFAYVEMRDDGEPLAEDDRVRIFQAYERGRVQDAAGPMGMGLGLAVSRHLARAMGGELQYDHDGTESVFRLDLPLRSTAAPAETVRSH